MKSKFFVIAILTAIGLLIAGSAMARALEVERAPSQVEFLATLASNTDTDGDGIVDSKDECPTRAGTRETHGCFENNVGQLCSLEYNRLNADPTWGKFAFVYYYKNDFDCDGVLNAEDHCENEIGYYTWSGCSFPADAFKKLCDLLDKSKGDFVNDRDCDGVEDADDNCPDVAGYYTYNGCKPLVFMLAPRILQPLVLFNGDSDGDGVVNGEDLCPDSPGTVEAHGCPDIPAAVDDVDGDAVIDADDECPDTPADVEVNAAGCPDTDGDGLFDNIDACKDDAADTEDGCPPVDASVAPNDDGNDTTNDGTLGSGYVGGGGCASMLVNTGNASNAASALIFAISLVPLAIRRRFK